jgi:hypothetical protein
MRSLSTGIRLGFCFPAIVRTRLEPGQTEVVRLPPQYTVLEKSRVAKTFGRLSHPFRVKVGATLVQFESLATAGAIWAKVKVELCKWCSSQKRVKTLPPPRVNRHVHNLLSTKHVLSDREVWMQDVARQLGLLPREDFRQTTERSCLEVSPDMKAFQYNGDRRRHPDTFDDQWTAFLSPRNLPEGWQQFSPWMEFISVDDEVDENGFFETSAVRVAATSTHVAFNIAHGPWYIDCSAPLGDACTASTPLQKVRHVMKRCLTRHNWFRPFPIELEPHVQFEVLSVLFRRFFCGPGFVATIPT